MKRIALMTCGFLFSAGCLAADPASAPSPAAQPATPAQAPAAAAVPAPAAVNAATVPASADPAALPPMMFVTSLSEDDVYNAFKSTPAFAGIDKELYGSPLRLVVTHTNLPTPGGQAAGVFTALLSGSTLGLIPIVSNERLVVRYEVMLNGKVVANCSFERKSTRAFSLWSSPTAYSGLGKDGIAWVKTTASEAAAKLATDPALIALRDEIRFYFPEVKSVASASPSTTAPAPASAPATSPAPGKP